MSYQLRQIFALFCNSVALTLGSDSVKCIRANKIVKYAEFGGVYGELESKKGFRRQSVTNI